MTSVGHGPSTTDHYTYDANGNMTCRVEQGVTFKQVYNAENRIASIAKLASGDCTTPGNYAAKWDFSYDGDGVRTNTLVTPYVNGLPQPAQLTSYYFGGAYETRSDGTTLKYYSFAGQMVAMRDETGLKYFLTDHLGSMVAITDDTGTLITQQRYLPFGAERTDVGTIAQTDFGFTSQRDLDEGMGGLMDYRARFYSPYLNRFLQPDSLIPDQTNPQAWNRFSYVVNRPINLNDPTGHCFSGAVIDTIACISVFVGAFFIFNGTSDSYQPNLSAGELESRQASVNLGVGITVSGLSVKSLAVEALSNIYDCATGAFCGPESLVPGSVKAYDNIPVTNPYPKSSRFVRLVPEDIAEEIASGNLEITLSHPGKLDSYISAAEDLGNYRTQVSVANRLSLPSDSLTKRNALVTFKYDLEIGLIASPINRTYPEFVGRGRTGGGAREWVIPNLPIKKLPINDIRIRRLE